MIININQKYLVYIHQRLLGEGCDCDLRVNSLALVSVSVSAICQPFRDKYFIR